MTTDSPTPTAAQTPPVDTATPPAQQTDITQPPNSQPPVSQPAADASKTAATVVSGDATTPTEPVVSKYPDDWREQFSKGDEKKLERLKRFASPEALAESYIEIEKKLRAGQIQKPITKDSTPEEIAEYRKAYGIPESPDKYDLEIGDGYIIGDDIKPQVDVFLEKMHAQNTPPAVVKEALKAYFDMQAMEDGKYLDEQKQLKDKTVTELRQEWGVSYDRNINVMKNFMQTQFGDAADAIMGATDLNGVPLMNNASIIRKFTQLALDNDPIGAVLPGNNAGTIDTINSEIAALENRIKTDRRGYFKDTAAQTRYQELLAARDTYKKK
jgi:hypothetical protein